MRIWRLTLCFWGLAWASLGGQESLVNWENAQVHPLDLTPGGSKLLAVNTADHRLEIFDLTAGISARNTSIPVGLDPVTVRVRNESEAWVVNHISDSISVIDLERQNVVRTLFTDDEPADVVFAGNPERAFVSCSQTNTILVFDLDDLTRAPLRVSIEGEDPRAMAVSADGARVFVAIFESGNGTTILGGGAEDNIAFPPNVVNHPDGPWGGVNPPPNDGLSFNPPQNPANPPPPRVGLIVRKDDQDRWLDDNSGDWTDLVSGPNASLSGRPVGWDLPDHDVAVLDTETLEVSYISGLMNINMALSVNPSTGVLAVVGTDATNETRYEPLLNGRFLRVNAALVSPEPPRNALIVDLNPHLTYTVATLPQSQRDLSLGDPRGITWNASGSRAYISGLGSNNVVVVDSGGRRVGVAPIEVGEGPTGVALDENRSRLYVLNRFEGSISVIDTVQEREIARVPFFDPTPAVISVGRKHLYDTHKNSGLGHVSCASCHVDARIDRLAWDLGNPAGNMKRFDQNCVLGVLLDSCEDWHPMKGPMTTQTLQDIIGKEPLHWRGDRFGIEEFNGAFLSLLGDDDNLTGLEMQQFEDFLATIHFPPNPYRNLDNSLPVSLPLPGHFTTGRFGQPGRPLPPGNASAGLDLFRDAGLDQGIDCVTCHTLPTGIGPNFELGLLGLEEIPPGPQGELHHAIVSVDGSTNVSIKIPQLRNLYDKVGFEATQAVNHAGFGFLHDGSVDSIARFVTEPVFLVSSVQEVADLVSFMLAFSGSNLPLGDASDLFELPGPLSKDTHAAVGRQLTFDGDNNHDAASLTLFGDMIFLAELGVVGLVAKGRQGGLSRGYMYVGGNVLQSDRTSESIGADELRLAAGPSNEVTFTVVPTGMQERVGVDRDEDGFFDRDELDACSDPADPRSTPGRGCSEFVRSDCNIDGITDLEDSLFLLNALFLGGQAPFCDAACDANADDGIDISDALFTLRYLFVGGAEPPAPFPECGNGPVQKLGCEDFSNCP